MASCTQDPNSGAKGEKKSRFSCRIDKEFLPVKAFYLFSHIAFATVQPYVVVYMKTQGLSAGETGVLAGSTPFLAFLAQPLLGAFADRWHKHKAVLIAAGFVTGVFQLMFVFVPARDPPAASGAQMTADTTVFCRNQTWPALAVCDRALEENVSDVAEYDVVDGYLDSVTVQRRSGGISPKVAHDAARVALERELGLNQSTTLPASSHTTVSSTDLDQHGDTKTTLSASKETNVEVLGTATNEVTNVNPTDDSIHTTENFTSTSGTPETETNTGKPKETPHVETVSDALEAFSNGLLDSQSVQCQLKCETASEEKHALCLSQNLESGRCDFTGSDSEDLYPDQYERLNNTDALIHSEANVSKLHDLLMNKTCQVYSVLSFLSSNGSRQNLTCQSNTEDRCQIVCQDQTIETPEDSRFDLTFALYYVIYLCAFLPEGLMQPMCNAIVYSMLRDQRHKYGRQRVFATFGYFLTSVATFVAMHIVTEKGEEVYYKGLFYNYVFFCWVSSFVVCTIQMPTDVHSDNMLKSTATLLSTPKIAAFLLVLFFFGIAEASITFLFWFITDLGAPPEVMPLTVVVGLVAEIPTMAFSGSLIKRVGPIPVLCLSVVIMCARMLCFSFLVNPWFVLAIEPMSGLSFAFMLNSATAYASLVAPPGMVAAAQGLVTGMFDGIGRGVGGFLTGWLFGTVGARTTYRAYAGTGIVVTVVYYILYRLFFNKQNPTQVRETDVGVKADSATTPDLTASQESQTKPGKDRGETDAGRETITHM